MRKNMVIAIDGYSSCGKSTLAKALAKALKFVYIDSGSMYRAVTLYFIRNNIELSDLKGVVAALENLELNFHSKDYESHILLNNEEVSEEIRQMHVSTKVSDISAIREVRLEMVKQQQRLGRSNNIVIDGRDIGTTVFPDAQVKFFMTADPGIRAKRRHTEMHTKGELHVTLEEVFDSLAHRDYADTTRVESPLVRADDAIVLDNTSLSPKEQLDFALTMVRRHLKV